jgi:tRNA pseudouridine38-40 synthase
MKIIKRYDGKNYFGVTKNHNNKTIQSVLEEAFSKTLKTKVSIIFSSRTDRYVHAFHNTAHFKVELEKDKVIFQIPF